MDNEFEYINDIIAKETSYQEGYDAGKQAGVEEFYKDLFRLGACSRGVILEPCDLAELKEKYNIS